MDQVSSPSKSKLQVLKRKTGRYKDSQIIRAETHEQELLWQPVPRQENINYHRQITEGLLWTIQA